MKPPAFQFYADDFLSGTADMTAEEVGVYIRLLAHSWSKDGLDDDDDRLARMAGQCQPNAVAYAKSKFVLVEGKLRNQRQEEERQKQTIYRQKQAEHAKKRWVGNADPMPSQCSPSPSPIYKHERESGFSELPSWEEVWAYAQTIGLAEWKARDWFDEMEGCGWLDFNHRPISKWQPVLNRVKTKWEADGRPSQPPSNQKAGAVTKAHSSGPKLSEVIAYAKEKWPDENYSNWAASFHGFWSDPKRDWKKGGKTIDWKVEFTGQAANWRTNK